MMHIRPVPRNSAPVRAPTHELPPAQASLRGYRTPSESCGGEQCAPALRPPAARSTPDSADLGRLWGNSTDQPLRERRSRSRQRQSRSARGPVSTGDNAHDRASPLDTNCISAVFSRHPDRRNGTARRLHDNHEGSRAVLSRARCRAASFSPDSSQRRSRRIARRGPHRSYLGSRRNPAGAVRLISANCFTTSATPSRCFRRLGGSAAGEGGTTPSAPRSAGGH